MQSDPSRTIGRQVGCSCEEVTGQWAKRVFAEAEIHDLDCDLDEDCTCTVTLAYAHKPNSMPEDQRSIGVEWLWETAQAIRAAAYRSSTHTQSTARSTGTAVSVEVVALFFDITLEKLRDQQASMGLEIFTSTIRVSSDQWRAGELVYVRDYGRLREWAVRNRPDRVEALDAADTDRRLQRK